MENTEYSLQINGFKTKAQVKAFIDWYEGQGEQDSSIWFECRKDEGEIDVDTMQVDLKHPYVWDEHNVLHARIKVY